MAICFLLSRYVYKYIKERREKRRKKMEIHMDFLVWYYQLRLVGYLGLAPNLEIEAANTGENQMLERWTLWRS